MKKYTFEELDKMTNNELEKLQFNLVYATPDNQLSDIDRASRYQELFWNMAFLSRTIMKRLSHIQK